MIEITEKQWQTLNEATDRAMAEITRQRGGVEINLIAELRRDLRERGEKLDDGSDP